ncbi:M35 family metallo-endopeptidase [Solihabitans fulvus]|uniref:M35 family metallo-endopeptidase n=1 Tax=Solihabitans fulvus TaxID=1892852 RepID=UPI001CB767CE
MFLRPIFRRAPLTGTDSKAGTLVHEQGHFTVNGGTGDYVYGQSGYRQLAKDNPSGRRRRELSGLRSFEDRAQLDEQVKGHRNGDDRPG